MKAKPLSYNAAAQSQPANFNDSSPWHSLTIDLDEVFMTYTNDRLLKGGETIDPSALLVPRKLANQCFLALSTTYFGHDHRQKGVVEKGLTRYGAALAGVHDALSDPKKSATYDILEAVILMALFETLMSSSKDGWVAHSLGMQRLFELRGPEGFQKMPERAVFQVSRPSIIFASLILRQPTILAEERWKTVPWAKEPDQKVMYHHVVDIGADCPGHLCDKDAALSLPEGSIERAKAIGGFITGVKHSLKLLAAWKKEYDTIEPDHCTEVPTTDDPPITTSGMLAWNTEYTFPNLYHASCLTLYHSLFIHLRRMIHTVDHELHDIDFETSIIEEYDSGIEICRSVNYHLHKAREGEGSFSFMFPLRMAWEAAELEPNVRTWVENVLTMVSTSPRGKWAVAGYLLDTEEIPQGKPGQLKV